MRAVVVKAGDIWATLAPVAGRAGSAEASLRAVGIGNPEVDLAVTASVASVGRDSRFGGFSSVTTFSGCVLL